MGEAIEVEQGGPGVGLEPARGDIAVTGRPSWIPTALIVAFSACLALAAIALLVAGPLDGAGPVRLLISQPEMFAVFCVLWAAAGSAPISIHHRGNTNLIVLDAVPMYIGLVFLSPPLLVLGCVVAETFVLAVVRRQSPVKVAFNVASIGFCAALASIVFRELLAGHSPASIWGWAVAAVALIVYNLTQTLNMRLAQTVNGQTPERRTGYQLTTEAMIIAASICLAIVVFDALWFSVWATIPLSLVAALIIATYRGYARLTYRFASLQRLYDFSRALGAANLEPSSMNVVVLRQVCTVMRARRALLVLADETGLQVKITLDDNDSTGIRLLSLDPSSFISATISTGKASRRVTTSVDNRGVAYDPIAGEYRAAVVAPLTRENMIVGAIVAMDRDEELDELRRGRSPALRDARRACQRQSRTCPPVEEIRSRSDLFKSSGNARLLTELANRDLFESRLGPPSTSATVWPLSCSTSTVSRT